MRLPLRRPPFASGAGGFMSAAITTAASFISATTHRRLYPQAPARTLSFIRYASSQPPPETSSEKRSLGVATGEFFIALAATYIKSRGVDYDIDVVADGDGRFPAGKEGVVWEQREKDVDAERRRKAVASPGFSFSAAGLLLPYHLGVAQFLIEKGYITENTPLAGSSAGAIACAIIASGASMREAVDATKVLCDDCRLKGTAFRLGSVLKEVLWQFLPEDSHIRASGRVRVAITQLRWRPRGLLIDQFDSKEDFIDALFTSSFIPGYLAPRPVTMYRNRLCIDGGLTLFMPPTSASQTVRICAFPISRLKLDDVGISPDCNPDNRASPRQLLNWALEPASDDILDNLFELGYMDAEVWGNQNPVGETVREEPLAETII